MPSILTDLPKLTTPPAPAAEPPTLREFGDTDTTRTLAIYANILKAAKEIPTVSNKFYSLGVEGSPHWDGPDTVSRCADQKKAINLRAAVSLSKLHWHLGAEGP